MTDSSFSINSVREDALQIIRKPVGFYQRMPHTGGYVEPMIFLAVMAAIAGLIVSVFSFFGSGLAGMMAFGVAAVIILPIFAIIGSFIGAAVMFVIWKLMGSDKSFETAYRCVAYASAIYPISAVLALFPYVGSLLGIAWGMYLMVVASVEVHGIPVNKAYIVFGILGVLMIISNVSSEMAAREAQDRLEQLGMKMEDMEGKTPEEIGRMVGEFMKGMEDAQKQPE
ncbi:YIP1 family protein [Pseudomonadota bacterium]